ncbi:MAG: hypothetical protein LC642_02405 [Verrucomicrobiaceae bacterium]|nr:hypothetical protein [Verrucomicrobiaceae bacterium]
MKPILISIALLAFGSSVFAQPPRSPESIPRDLPTFDVPAFLEQQGTLLGRTVAIRFHYRSEKLRHLKPSWYEASLWQRDPKAKKGFSFVRVMVAKKNLAAFKTITSDFQSAVELTAYGRVEREPEAHYIYLRIQGGKW